MLTIVIIIGAILLLGLYPDERGEETPLERQGRLTRESNGANFFWLILLLLLLWR